MSSLRGGQKLWAATSIATGAKSPLAQIGPGQNVTVYIANTDPATDGVVLDVEVAASDKTEAGRNALDGTADGGLVWCKYEKVAGTKVQITVDHGKAIAVDLSPFGPQFIRLLRSDGGSAAIVSAWVSSYGAN